MTESTISGTREERDDDHYVVLGGPGSPYSHKLRAVLRYRRIPHYWRVPNGPPLAPGSELAKTGKSVLPVLRYPDGSHHTDTTPLILELERRHPGRSVLPDDPALAFLARLIEDFADEWLVYAMFHFRWDRPEDVQFCAKRQIAGWLGAGRAQQIDQLAQVFTARQQSLLHAVGGPRENIAVYLRTYERLLDTLERMLEDSLFLFGSRPSIADFGIYGALSQCAVDPTTSRILRERAVRTYQWIQLIDDTSGLEGSWQEGEEPSAAVRALLEMVGEAYLPYLVALSDALARGEREIALAPWGIDYVRPVPPDQAGAVRPAGLHHQVRCLGWLRVALAELPDEARGRVEPWLEQTGCRDALAMPAGAVPPLLPS